MTEQELIEKLAAAEHASWARWQEYLHSRCIEGEVNGETGLFISKSFVDHWNRQIATPYEQLSEREKQSDRAEVAHILPLIREYVRSEFKRLLYNYLMRAIAGNGEAQ